MKELIQFQPNVSFTEYSDALKKVLTHYDKTFQTLILCPNCKFGKADKVIPVDSKKSDAKHITFHCSNCKNIWYLCGSCPVSKQPILNEPTTCKRDKKKFQVILNDCMTDHECTHHSLRTRSESLPLFATDSHSSNRNNEDSPIDTHIDSDQFESEFHDSDFISTHSKHEIDHVFPSRDLLSSMILKKQNSKCYATEIIGKCWSVNNSCRFRDSDVLLFLKVMRNLISGSRDENFEFTDILYMIERRKDMLSNALLKRVEYLEHRVTHLENINNHLTSLIDGVGISTDFYQNEQELPTSIKSVRNDKLTDPRTEYEYTHNSLHLPTSMHHVRKLLEGKNSFVSNLCTPKIKSCPEFGYALSDIVESFKISLSLGLQFDYRCIEFESSHPRSIFHSKNIIQKISNCDSRNDSCVNIIFGMWSDGCEAGGLTKGSRSSVKLTTAHLCNSRISLDHVFPIAIGRSKGDHAKVRNYIWNDIKALTRRPIDCIVYGWPGITKVRFIMGYMIQDRPEHSEWTGFMAHNGVFSTVPGISFPIRLYESETDDSSGKKGLKIDRYLLSCNRCYLRRRNFLKNEIIEYDMLPITSVCDICDDWNISKVTFEPHKEYPNDSPSFSNRMMAKKITFHTMKEAMKVIFEKIFLHQWTRVKAEKFAQVECIRRDIVSDIYDYATKIRPKKKSDVQQDTTIPTLPDRFFPAAMLQEILPLEDFLVGVMHTVILNLGRHFQSAIKDLLSEQNDWRYFYDHSNNLHTSVRRLSLNWCKAWNYGTNRDKPFSSWVSENFLGSSIIMKGLIPTINGLPSISERQKVILIESISSYTSIIARVMNPEYPTDNQCKILYEMIKLFLSRFNELDKELVMNVGLRKIETASCFLNLLKVPELMKKNGVQRNFWEGDLKGEGIVHVFKPLIRRGVDLSGSMSTILSRMYNLREIDSVIRDHTNRISENIIESVANEDEKNSYEKDRYRKFKSYRSESDVREAIDQRQPIACSYDSISKKFHFLIGIGSSKKWHRCHIQTIRDYYEIRVCKVSMPEVTSSRHINEVQMEAYISVICIPMKVGAHGANIEEFGYLLRDENHLELVSTTPFKFDFPKVYFDTPTDARCIDLGGIVSHGQSETLSIVDFEGRQVSSLNKFRDRNFCKKWIGKKCTAIEGCTVGAVVDFSYAKNLSSFPNCRWKIKYYRYSRNDPRSIKTITVNYWEMIKCITT